MVRIKHRYLLLNILYPDPKTANVRLAPKPGEEVPYSVQFRQPSSDQLNGKMLMRLIQTGVAELFGDYGSGKVAGSLQVKYLSPATSTAIIRVSRDHYRLIWAALTYTTHLPKPLGQPCVMQVVRVSGTIRKAEEEAVRRARVSIRRAQAQVGGKGVALPVSEALAATAAVAEGDDDLGMFGGIEDVDEPGDGDEEDEDG